MLSQAAAVDRRAVALVVCEVREEAEMTVVVQTVGAKAGARVEEATAEVTMEAATMVDEKEAGGEVGGAWWRRPRRRCVGRWR